MELGWDEVRKLTVAARHSRRRCGLYGGMMVGRRAPPEPFRPGVSHGRPIREEEAKNALALRRSAMRFMQMLAISVLLAFVRFQNFYSQFPLSNTGQTLTKWGLHPGVNGF